MAYKEISGNVKTKAVLDVFDGKSISVVARKYRISRASLYHWVSEIKAVIREHFVKPNAAGNLMSFLNQRLRKTNKKNFALEAELLRKDEKIKELKGMLKVVKDLGRPDSCSACGCEKIYKNGCYPVTQGYLAEQLIRTREKKIKVRHYICASCGQSFCLVDPLKNVFYLNSSCREEGLAFKNRKAIV